MNNKTNNYNDYLKIDKLLELQNLKSIVHNNESHDEMLFIVIHQIYELWFKQIIHELDSIIFIFTSKYSIEQNIGLISERFNRIIEIQKLLIKQIDILDTMTPMDFLEFRDYLIPASGFQSAQFRIIENKLGLKIENRIKFAGQKYDQLLIKLDKQKVNNSEKNNSLFNIIEKWLERTPFLKFDKFDFWDSYKKSVDNMINNDINKIKQNNLISIEAQNKALKNYENIKKSFNALFNEKEYNRILVSGSKRLTQKATLAALFIELYRDEPILQLPHKLLNQLVEIDQLMTSWRNRHSLLVFRMIGNKIGTGGSAGHKYLNKTVNNHKIFTDISSLSTYIIPRSSLPELPHKLKKVLGFYFTYGDKK